MEVCICVNLNAFPCDPVVIAGKSIFGHPMNVVYALVEILLWILTVEVAASIFEPQCILCSHMHLYAIFTIVVFFVCRNVT